jgi:hypothetical protein
MILYFDTALTGRYHYRDPDDKADQPHLCRLAMQVVAPSGAALLNICHLIVPGPLWPFESDAVAAHGISPGMADEHGIPLEQAISVFVKALAEATTVVAFNYDHHRRVILRSAADLRIEMPIPEMGSPPAFCAMREATNHVRAPRTGPGGGIRWPRMAEAFSYFNNGSPLSESPDPRTQGHLNVQAIRRIHEGILAERAA